MFYLFLGPCITISALTFLPLPNVFRISLSSLPCVLFISTSSSASCCLFIACGSCLPSFSFSVLSASWTLYHHIRPLTCLPLPYEFSQLPLRAPLCFFPLNLVLFFLLSVSCLRRLPSFSVSSQFRVSTPLSSFTSIL